VQYRSAGQTDGRTRLAPAARAIQRRRAVKISHLSGGGREESLSLLVCDGNWRGALAHATDDYAGEALKILAAIAECLRLSRLSDVCNKERKCAESYSKQHNGKFIF